MLIAAYILNGHDIDHGFCQFFQIYVNLISCFLYHGKLLFFFFFFFGKMFFFNRRDYHGINHLANSL